MGIKIEGDINKITKDLLKDLNRRLEKAHDESAQFMLKQFDLSFENRGFQNTNSRGKGFEPYEPTTFTAKQFRKKYPKSPGNSNGKRGLTPEQKRYLLTANSLEDTGGLRNSETSEKEMIQHGLMTHVGAGKPYIKTHEDGGTITSQGKTFDVPARPFQHITEQEAQDIENIFARELTQI